MGGQQHGSVQQGVMPHAGAREAVRKRMSDMQMLTKLLHHQPAQRQQQPGSESRNQRQPRSNGPMRPTGSAGKDSTSVMSRKAAEKEQQERSNDAQQVL